VEKLLGPSSFFPPQPKYSKESSSNSSLEKQQRLRPFFRVTALREERLYVRLYPHRELVLSPFNLTALTNLVLWDTAQGFFDVLTTP
jgi:hypothetical protein